MFNYNTLEKDIEKLSREIAEKKNIPEHKETPERELIKQVITPLVLQTKRQAAGTVNNSQSASDAEETVLPDYLKDSPAETKLQVEKLVKSVFSDGLEKTVKKAVSSNAFVLDAFHDALTDKLYDELKARKLI
ncbi:MAG: hypothetical protein D4Q79_01685 [Spirochaetia bacterium]|nr:MAG: hypothetical protein D4Q79_01685 [Spirochaetia bacterium]